VQTGGGVGEEVVGDRVRGHASSVLANEYAGELCLSLSNECSALKIDA
jgi:hypothetical protein